jgi:AcrR family transcriptional regulator
MMVNAEIPVVTGANTEKRPCRQERFSIDEKSPMRSLWIGIILLGNSLLGPSSSLVQLASSGPYSARSYSYQELHTLWAAMPRPKTGDKRAAILRAATKTIAEDGIGASTSSIAKAAAVAEGSLFRYFPDKDKLLNELYRELKLDMRNAMIAGFPLTGSLRKRVQHIWNAYVTWGMESPAKRRAMMQVTVSERITDQSRQEGQVGFEDATEAMQQFVAQGKLSGLPPAFASDLLLAMAETTMASMVANPAKAEHYRSAGFEAFWSAAGKK